MDHQKKLDFVLKMTKHALEHVQHFDSGGTVLTGPSAAGTQNATDPGAGLFGAVNNFLGTNNRFQASPATITPGTNTAQLNNAYTGVQSALDDARAVTGTLGPGLGRGVGSQAYLTDALTKQSQGIGPNPAQAALNQNTGRNIAQSAALAAGTRGAGANAGLVALNAANTGANAEQQAVGQEATLQAQQQLSAQGQLANLAENQIGQETNAVQLQNQTQQNAQNILQGANTAANNAAVTSQNNVNTTNAQVSTANAQSNANTAGGIGGLLGDIGGALFGFSEGGKVPKHLEHLHEVAKIYHPHLAGGGRVWQNSIPVSSSIDPQASMANVPFTLNNLFSNFDHNAFHSSEEDETEEKDAQGGTVGSKLKKGGKVPGKPKVPYNASENDTVDAKLSPGEAVIDLETLQAKTKLGKMARFVAKEIERKKAGRKLV